MKKLACLILLGIVSPLANAAAPTPGMNEQSFDFALSFGRTKTEFAYSDSSKANSTIEFVEISWYERVAPGIDIGLHLGKTFLDQTGRSTTVGVEPDGAHGSVGLRATLFETSWVQPFMHALYTYRRVENNDNGQSVVLSWYEPQVRLGVITLPWNRLRVYGGASWSSIDGRERIKGATPSTTDFERKSAVDGFFGVDLAVEESGFVGVEARAGDNRGVEFYFRKRY
jgi:hypothetical protein